METFFGITAAFGAVIFLGSACMMHGYKRGYLKGRFDADHWWDEQEAGIDQERMKIWREAGRR